MLFLITLFICVLVFIACNYFDKYIGSALALWASLWIFIVVGWIANVIALIGMAKVDAAIGTLFVLRAAGVFIAPLGSILGFFV